jgi:hypothetical protein
MEPASVPHSPPKNNSWLPVAEIPDNPQLVDEHESPDEVK